MKLEVYDNPADAIGSVQCFISENSTYLDAAKILEAGCGSLSRIKLPENVKVTGVDISKKQLDRNVELTERIVGDLQQVELGSEKYRLCICWDVLEHLERPELAVERILKSVVPDGYIIFALPNARSLKGLVTKTTPHFFHVWYYKKILGIADAGKNDTAPFETYLKGIIAPKNLMKLVKSRGFTVEKLIFRDGMVHRLKLSHPSLWWIYYLLSKAIYLATLGQLGGMSNSDYILVARKAGRSM